MTGACMEVVSLGLEQCGPQSIFIDVDRPIFLNNHFCLLCMLICFSF